MGFLGVMCDQWDVGLIDEGIDNISIRKTWLSKQKFCKNVT